MASKSIALITTQAFSVANFRGPLIVEMQRRGYTIYAFAPDYDQVTRERVEALGAIPVSFRMSRTGINPILDIRALFDLVGELRRVRPSLVLAYFAKAVIYGSCAGFLARVQRRYALLPGLGYVFIYADSTSLKHRLLLALVTLLYRVSLGLVDRVIFQNSDDLRELVDRGIVRRERTTIVGGTGVDCEVWRFTPPVTSPVTFTLAGRLLREKGVVEFVEAARILRKVHPNIRILLLGDTDPNPGSLSQSVIEGWVNEGILEWCGHVDVKPWLAQTSVFVLPSYREGLPRSVQEAMAMGRPIITTDVPGCRETVRDGVNGFLVPARDTSSLARAMERFIDDPHLIAEMGLASRTMAEERFDVNRINQQMIEIMGM